MDSKADLSSIRDSDDSRNVYYEKHYDYHKIDITDCIDAVAEVTDIKAEQEYNTFKCEVSKSLYEH